MVSRETARQLYSHAAAFCCPSVYEPFGIINLEAAACETPVVASAVGGIPEVVVDGETGLLVPVELSVGRSDAAGRPRPLRAQPGRRDQRPHGGSRHARGAWAARPDDGRSSAFGWDAIARQTADLYRSVVEAHGVG